MEFLKSAKDFARNPLGIIALFISLIYGFASLLLSVSAEKLTENERWPIIIFIVVFPVLVLMAFYRLVTNHHGKLYAPADFKDDKSFLVTLSAEEQERKLEKEVNETLGEAIEDIVEEKIVPPTKNQKRNTKNISESVSKKQEHMKFRNDLKEVEEVVINEIGKELNAEMRRNVGVGSTGASFDAIAISNSQELPIFIEVKALKSSSTSTAMLERVLYNAVIAEKYFMSNSKLILTVVYYFEKDRLPSVKDAWEHMIKQSPANVELRFIARNELPMRKFT
ncbi:hypothetical protein OC523_007460 [Vibrio vulnificus]|nr:hypothetical protein [Vibrio vulnificus]EHH0747092.1 hypothetical protein [Vibrio vulnificus]ELR8730117.1 hypothetical protein [Vibrio vulnificus]MCU8461475.1 hypothetical protein [Vibrio vulnificus]